jgi:group I intron endonuclease
MENQCAVYRILNKVNNKSYIGSSKDVSQRKRQHFYNLRHHIHPVKELLDDYVLYGEEHFEFQILETVYDLEQLLIREQWWIDNIPLKYNKAPYTDIHLPTYIPNDETKSKISSTIKQQWADGKYDHKRGMHYNWKAGHNPRLGVKLTDEQKKHLSEINSGENNSNYGKHRSEESKKRSSLGHTKPNKYPGAVSPDGTIYAPINNMSAFCREHDLGVSEMISVMHERRKAHKGWTLYKDG